MNHKFSVLLLVFFSCMAGCGDISSWKDEPDMIILQGDYHEVVAVEEPQYEGGSGIGTVVVEFKNKDGDHRSRRVLVSRSSEMVKGDIVMLDNVHFFPNTPWSFSTLAAVPREKAP